MYRHYIPNLDNFKLVFKLTEADYFIVSPYEFEEYPKIEDILIVGEINTYETYEITRVEPITQLEWYEGELGIILRRVRNRGF